MNRVPLRSMSFVVALLAGTASGLLAQDAREFIVKGQMSMQNKQYDSAMSYFEAAIAREPLNGEAVYDRAVCLLGLRRLEEAEKALGDALGLVPDYANAWINRGSIRAQRGALSEASDDFTAAIRLDTNSSIGYYMRGQVNLQAGKLEEGVKDLTRCLALEKDASRASKVREMLATVGFAPLGGEVASFSDKEANITISLPKEWFLKADDDGKAVNMFVSQQKVEKEGDQFAVGASIHRIRRVSKSFPDLKTGGVLLVDFWVKGLEEVGRQYPYYKVLSSEPMTIGTYVGVKRLVAIKGQGAPFEVKMYEVVVGHDDDLVTVTLEAPSQLFDRYDAIYRAAMSSLRIAK